MFSLNFLAIPYTYQILQIYRTSPPTLNTPCFFTFAKFCIWYLMPEMQRVAHFTWGLPQHAYWLADLQQSLSLFLFQIFAEHLLAQELCKKLGSGRGMRHSLFFANSQSKASVFYSAIYVSSFFNTDSEYRTAYLDLWLLKM